MVDISISNDTTNNLLKRREISFDISYDGKTPSRSELKEELCRKLNLSPELTEIVKINQKYGMQHAEALAHSYLSKEAMDAIVKKEEPAPKAAAQNAPKEEASTKEETAAKEETPTKEKAYAKEEAPAKEEVKEEKAAEEKDKE